MLEVGIKARPDTFVAPPGTTDVEESRRKGSWECDTVLRTLAGADPGLVVDGFSTAGDAPVKQGLAHVGSHLGASPC